MPKNHLANETSPYLLQHADNPVDWYPWGAEALSHAQAEDKPILLSIGYSACHWCHVMAHESFEDDATASFMNSNFINVKVDREERPDIDDIYMQATLVFTQGHGGWPMTVFLTPEGKPFHAGTYFPKEDRYGMPSFRRVMGAVLEAYRNRREQIEQGAAQVADSLRRDDIALGGTDTDLNKDLLEKAYRRMILDFDPINGGLHRGAPKFPASMSLEFVLRQHLHEKREKAEEVLTFTLRKMAQGGMYDQIGGGFHRYSVDTEWLVPHFEKMLYDNAQLSRIYLRAWQTVRDPYFRHIAEEIHDYILREMTTPEGGFYSATDADSEGEEGRFFVWQLRDIQQILSGDLLDTAIAFWNITEQGNFEGSNILYIPRDESEVAAELGIDLETLRARIDDARHKLYAARTHRVHPGLDDKILTAWNGLMLASLAEAARVLNRDDYRAAAVRNADFLLAQLVAPDGRLYRTHKNGVSKLNGYLEDYANLIDGLLEVYQLTFDARYFREAQRLADHVLDHFAAPDGGFFDTSDDHEALIARPRNLQDNATPSGNSRIARDLLLLGAYTGDDKYGEAARSVLRKLVNAVQQYPSAFGEALNALDLLVYGVQEVAVVGEIEQARPLFDVVEETFRPTLIRAYTPNDVEDGQTPPLLDYRMKVDGKAAAYVCENFVCKRPVTDADALRALLR